MGFKRGVQMMVKAVMSLYEAVTIKSRLILNPQMNSV